MTARSGKNKQGAQKAAAPPAEVRADRAAAATDFGCGVAHDAHSQANQTQQVTAAKSSPEPQYSTAPYAHVPISEPTQLEMGGGRRRSGHLDLTLTALTPLLIGEHRICEDGWAHSDPLTMPDGRAWIPGSALRGAVRSVLEAALGAPLLVDDRPLGIRAPIAGMPRVNAYAQARGNANYSINNERIGLLRRRGDVLEIVPSDLVRVPWDMIGLHRTDDPKLGAGKGPLRPQVITAQRVGSAASTQFAPLRLTEKSDRGQHVATSVDVVHPSNANAYLLLTGLRSPGAKHPQHHAYAAKLTAARAIPVAEEARIEWQALRTHSEKEFVPNVFAPEYSALLERGVPVFYDTDQLRHMVVRFGFSRGFRVATKLSWREAVARAAHPDTVDSSAVEALLGTVRVSRDGSLENWLGAPRDSTGHIIEVQRQGRVRFGHAVATSQTTTLVPAALALSSPNRGANHLRLEPTPGRSAADFADPGAAVRGRAFYLHRWTSSTTPEAGWAEARGEHVATAPGDATGLSAATHTWYRPLATGTFSARVLFEHLTDLELGAVLYGTTLDTGDGGAYAHKLGALRPLGLGSVTITATLIFDEPASDDWEAGFREGSGGSQLDADETVETLISGFLEQIRQTRPAAIHALGLITRWDTRPTRARTAEMNVAAHAWRIPLRTLDELFSSGAERPPRL